MDGSTGRNMTPASDSQLTDLSESTGTASTTHHDNTPPITEASSIDHHYADYTYPPVIVVSGVSGSGKTTIGTLLAKRLSDIEQHGERTSGAAYEYIEGDDYHSDANKEKMGRGIPLNDHDRLPWLQTLASVIHQHLTQHHPCVIACSALKHSYRHMLTAASAGVSGDREADKHHETKDPIRFVLLNGSEKLLQERMKARKGHYMKDNMLRSQLDTLEAPSVDENVAVVDVTPPPLVIFDNIMKQLATPKTSQQQRQ